MDANLHHDLEAKLLDARRRWEHRLSIIQKDRRRESAPLDPDYHDRAIQRENDDTLDALDAHGRDELRLIDSALARLASDTLELCIQCGDRIATSRLRAQPTAETCLRCALNNRITQRPRNHRSPTSGPVQIPRHP